VKRRHYAIVVALLLFSAAGVLIGLAVAAFDARAGHTGAAIWMGLIAALNAVNLADTIATLRRFRRFDADLREIDRLIAADQLAEALRLLSHVQSYMRFTAPRTPTGA